MAESSETKLQRILSQMPGIREENPSLRFTGLGNSGSSAQSRDLSLIIACETHGIEFSLSIRAVKRFVSLGRELCGTCRAITKNQANSLQLKRPDLAAMWDFDRNATPLNAVSLGSQQRFFWVCFVGHESWLASPDELVRGWRMCPCCPGSHKLVLGCNDLATTHPEVAIRWDYERNDLTPTEVKIGVNRKFFFQCQQNPEHHPHMYLPSLRKNASACTDCWQEPIVCGKNDFGCLYPELALRLLEDERYVDPHSLRPGDERDFTWRCDVDEEHFFLRTIATMTRPRSKFSCPVCRNRKIIPDVNSLAKLFPDIAAEWDYELNGQLTSLRPETIAPRAGHEVYWKCSAGHSSFKSAVWNRTSGETGCPSCANYGYRGALPGLLYLIEREESDSYRGARKLGITNVSSRQTRLKHWGYQGFRVVHTIAHTNGNLISKLESTFLRNVIRDEFGLGQELSQEEIIGGHTETFSLRGPTNEELVERLERLKRTLEFQLLGDSSV